MRNLHTATLELRWKDFDVHHTILDGRIVSTEIITIDRKVFTFGDNKLDITHVNHEPPEGE